MLLILHIFFLSLFFVVPFSSSEGIRCITPFEWLHSFCLCLFSCVPSVLFVSSVASSVSVTANRDFPISAQPSVSLLRQRRLQLSVGCVRRPSEGVAQPSEGVGHVLSWGLVSIRLAITAWRHHSCFLYNSPPSPWRYR